MSWLVRIEMDTDKILALGIRDSYEWHKRIWECFPDAPEHERDFLTRIDPLEGATRVWLLSSRKPTCPPWCSLEDFERKELSTSFLSHRHYVFDLRANPTKALVQRGTDGRVVMQPNGKLRSGKRVPLVKPAELRTWLDRKANAGGFRIHEAKPLEIGPMIEEHFRKKGHSGYHGGVQFRGVLEVIDATRFAETYAHGLGSAKGFGFGLLLLAPINL